MKLVGSVCLALSVSHATLTYWYSPTLLLEFVVAVVERSPWLGGDVLVQSCKGLLVYIVASAGFRTHVHPNFERAASSSFGQLQSSFFL